MDEREVQEFGIEAYGRYYSFYKGFVADNQDPDFLGRLKIKVPQIFGDEVPDYWAWSKGMYAGNQIGFFAIPNIGDGVWVSFEAGDPRFPIWEYGWFGEGDVPSAAKNNGNKPTNNVLQTTSGHRIELDDKNELIRITDKHGHIVKMNKNGVSTVSDKISLGSLDGSAEPAVLGNTAMNLLNEFIADLGNIGAITTPVGPTATISTSPQWAALVSKWQTKWGDFKSQVVTLD